MTQMPLVYGRADAWTAAGRQECFVESTELTPDLDAKGQYLGASPLEPVSTATSVRVRDGRRVVMDGPFAETREQLGGYFLVDAADLDEAIAIAERIPGACRGTIEVRPLVDLPALPKERPHDATRAKSNA